MGQLPLEWVAVTRPLLNSGIDYVGQFEIKSGNTRSNTIMFVMCPCLSA